MYVLNVRNVNEGLQRGVRLILEKGQAQSSRGKVVLEVPEPVATVYSAPWERVLFDPVRDANPFFHFMEAIWMLGGRRDVKWLQQFNRRIADYSDDGETFHGAYGHRLRRFPDIGDQLQYAVERLRREPDTRQVVLSIWDAARDLGYTTKDTPCNLSITLKIRQHHLHMTVFNRSNDIIWGLYGVNAVQFSFLQEYLAASVGVHIGPLTHVSDSFHVYPDNPYWKNWRVRTVDPYSSETVRALPLITRPDMLMEEIERFLGDPKDELPEMFPEKAMFYVNPLISEVALPMYAAWEAHKARDGGTNLAEEIGATDWRKACVEWLARRETKATPAL